MSLQKSEYPNACLFVGMMFDTICGLDTKQLDFKNLEPWKPSASFCANAGHISSGVHMLQKRFATGNTHLNSSPNC
ncbi:hypothetical protein TWF694_001532 [Orbilia ellipsospora]|uniref:Uncharacterized protein n=1 Tax=Orbilia ellipsospora TaxID=2528407 RepID=A0AAV9XTR4_9PEZI